MVSHAYRHPSRTRARTNDTERWPVQLASVCGLAKLLDANITHAACMLSFSLDSSEQCGLYGRQGAFMPVSSTTGFLERHGASREQRGTMDYGLLDVHHYFLPSNLYFISLLPLTKESSAVPMASTSCATMLVLVTAHAPTWARKFAEKSDWHGCHHVCECEEWVSFEQIIAPWSI